RPMASLFPYTTLFRSDALTRERWQGSSIRTMIENTVAGYSQVGRVTLAGPDFWLSPSNGVTFSLIVHELAVNATKHGALSGGTGDRKSTRLNSSHVKT